MNLLAAVMVLIFTDNLHQKHSGSCTESFYRENVVDVMKGQRASADEQKQMAKILRRVHEADQPLDGILSLYIVLRYLF
jgi:hypothetical protein